MNWFEKAVAKSYTEWNVYRPPYGWFHWIWILTTLAATIFSSWFFRNRKGYPLRIYLFVYSILMLVLEVWKECGESYKKNGDTGEYVWAYNWTFFPLQFCSLPPYIALIAGFIYVGTGAVGRFMGVFKNTLYSFLGTFGLFGGFITYAVPMEILGYEAIFSLIHTFVFHGFMIVICTTLLVSHVELKVKSVIFASFVFLFFVGLAEIGNVVYYRVNPGDYFSLMHISPYYETRLPVFPYFQKVNFALFIISYVVLFVIVAFLVLFLRIFIGWLCSKIKLHIEVMKRNRKGKGLDSVINEEGLNDRLLNGEDPPDGKRDETALDEGVLPSSGADVALVTVLNTF